MQLTKALSTLFGHGPAYDRQITIITIITMERETFNELWDTYIPQTEPSEESVNNGVNPILAEALKKADCEDACLAVEFGE